MTTIENNDAEQVERLNGRVIELLRERDKYKSALESIAGWRKVNIQGEYEHGLRDIIRSVVDCAATALQ